MTTGFSLKDQIIIIGSGNAAMSAGIAALENGSCVTILEKAPEKLSGGNTKYTAGAMRFCFNGMEDLIPLLQDPNDPRLKNTEFGCYSETQFANDLLSFNDGKPLSDEAISKVISEQGIDLARRTVAKYREMLNIPSSSQRRMRARLSEFR